MTTQPERRWKTMSAERLEEVVSIGSLISLPEHISKEGKKCDIPYTTGLISKIFGIRILNIKWLF